MVRHNLRTGFFHKRCLFHMPILIFRCSCIQFNSKAVKRVFVFVFVLFMIQVASTIMPYKIHSGSRSATWGFAAYYPLTFLQDWSPRSAPMVKLLNHLCFFAFMLGLDVILATSAIGNMAGFFIGAWMTLIVHKYRWFRVNDKSSSLMHNKDFWLRLHGILCLLAVIIITAICFNLQVNVPEFLSDFSPKYCGGGVKPLNNPAAIVLYDEHEFDYIVYHTNTTLDMLGSSCM